MNEWALYLGMAAALCMLCSLLGTALCCLWGVDPSREAPGTYTAHALRRQLMARISCFTALLPASLWLGAYLGQMLGSVPGAACCALYALACALLGFLATFVSVRHDGLGMAHVYGEELFEKAKKLRDALGSAACVLSGGALLMSILRDGWVAVTNAHLFAFSCAMGPMLIMQMGAGRIAPVITSEKQMLPASTGGAVSAGLIAMLMLLPGSATPLRWEIAVALWIMITLVWGVSCVVLVRLGGQALHGLLERPFAAKKRGAWPEMLLCAAACALLSLIADAWLFIAAAVLCAMSVLMDVIACTVWIRRIGRGLFSRNRI